MKRLWRALLRLVPVPIAGRVFQSWVNVLATRSGPAEALRNLFALEEHVHRELDHAAMQLDGGIHAKHRLTGYHDFFVERVGPGDRVLDVGSGKGELAYDLAVRSGAEVVGIDVKPASIAFARERFAAAGVRFVEGNVLDVVPDGPFDVVVLSNVIEHLEPRVELLQRLVAEYRPRRFLIRVPAENRHWHVPLRRELGLPWFSDPSHVVEYDEARLRDELKAAGVEAIEIQSAWGELWAEARPAVDG